MSGKRFRARRRYAHTRVWVITALILTLGGLALHTVTRQTVFPLMALGIGLAGVAVGFWQDRRERVYYGLEAGQLLLRRGQIVERIALDAIQDASLVDRRAARDLLMERKRLMEELGRVPAEREEFQRQSTRWCSVDIGLGAFSFGHELLDRRPDGKYDLVLLRLQDGRTLLLSPVYNQDLISALNKGKGREERREHRA
jgi:hypothetical protein